jgi:hypothetical protein
MRSGTRRLSLLPLLLVAAAMPSCKRAQTVVTPPPHPKEVEVELLTPAFRVNRIFKSMVGPQMAQPVLLKKSSETPELFWLTGYAMEVVGPDGKTPESMDFECHTNLDWSDQTPPDWSKRSKPRAFTLTQGQTDVRLPPGFGLPMLSNERLLLGTQVLNLNEPNIDRQVKHRVRLRYVRDRDLTEPMKPLIATNAPVMVSLEEKPLVPNVSKPAEHLEGATCQVGEFAGDVGPLQDRLGRSFSQHWVVTPGRHEFHTVVTDRMAIPYDTTIHFIGVHVHPHSESLELRDLTTGETVYKSHHETSEGKLGLERIDYFSSAEGIPVYRDHDYEVVSVYDNPTRQDSDAMAVMFLYYLDQEFRHPLPQPAAAAEPATAERRGDAG